ncbi:Hypothetical predicted protein [Cloeon dipterum]|uniref:Uncharacterized protein n=1 Tax=Cloeon dipterum TaxID=197152 RepID=A0A8S1C9X8_9INSE|nr:Hypothetical predicted protein [Cloeon dipterum]
MEQRRNNIKVTSALLFLFVSPSWAFFLPFNTEPAARIIVRKQHLLQYPSSRRYVLTQNLQHDQFVGFSPSLKSQGSFIPYYSTNGQVVLNEIVTIQPSQGFPQGIIAVQPIITHGGFLNLGSHGQAAFPAQGLANKAALSFLQSLLGQHLPAAAPAPAEPEAPAAPEPVATEAPTTTVAPETPAQPTITAAPAPAPARPEITVVIVPAPHPAPAYLPQAAPAAPAQTIPQGLFPQGWNFGQNAQQPSVSANDKFLINVPEFNQPKSEATSGNDGAASNYNVVANHKSGADASIGSSFPSFRTHHIKSEQPAAVHNYVYGQKFQHEQPLVGSQATGPAGHYDFGYTTNNHYVAQGRKYRRESS